MPLSGLREGFSVTAIAVAQKVSRGGIPRKGIPKLLSCPFCGGVGRDATVQDAATIMGKHEENKQQPKGRSWHHEEISGNQLLHVILQECLPGLGRGPTGMDHVLGHCGFASRCPASEVRHGSVVRPSLDWPSCFSYEVANLAGFTGPALADSTLPGPVKAESFAVPRNHGCWLNDSDARAPTRP